MGAEVVVLGRADSLEALSEVYETAATILDGMEDGAENGQTVFGGLRAGTTPVQPFDRLRIVAEIADSELPHYPSIAVTEDDFR